MRLINKAGLLAGALTTLLILASCSDSDTSTGVTTGRQAANDAQGAVETKRAQHSNPDTNHGHSPDQQHGDNQIVSTSLPVTNTTPSTTTATPATTTTPITTTTPSTATTPTTPPAVISGGRQAANDPAPDPAPPPQQIVTTVIEETIIPPDEPVADIDEPVDGSVPLCGAEWCLEAAEAANDPAPDPAPPPQQIVTTVIEETIIPPDEPVADIDEPVDGSVPLCYSELCLEDAQAADEKRADKKAAKKAAKEKRSAKACKKARKACEADRIALEIEDYEDCDVGLYLNVDTYVLCMGAAEAKGDQAQLQCRIEDAECVGGWQMQ